MSETARQWQARWVFSPLQAVLHRVLRLRLKAACSACSPERLLRSLHQIQRHSVRIAGRTYQGITRPTPEQRELFEEVGIAPPKHPA